jgi:hypothetical protein
MAGVYTRTSEKTPYTGSSISEKTSTRQLSEVKAHSPGPMPWALFEGMGVSLRYYGEVPEVAMIPIRRKPAASTLKSAGRV